MKIEQKHFDAMIAEKKCRFWDDIEMENKEGFLISLQIRASKPFIDGNGKSWPNCEPIKTVRYFKEPVDMMRALVEGGWKPNSHGDFEHPRKKYFNHPLWFECGKPEDEWEAHWSVDPSWIEEREE